jgi:hypothetical protein
METSMAEHEDDWIRQRAYALWEEEGRPSGKDAAHWEQARREHGATGSKSVTSTSQKSTKSAGKTSPATSADVPPTPSGAAAKKSPSKGAGEKKSATKRSGKTTAGS